MGTELCQSIEFHVFEYILILKVIKLRLICVKLNFCLASDDKVAGKPNFLMLLVSFNATKKRNRQH